MDNQEFTKALSAELRAQAARLGLNNSQIARHTGINMGTLRRYMLGERDIPLWAFSQVIDMLGLDATETIDKATNNTKTTFSHKQSAKAAALQEAGLPVTDTGSLDLEKLFANQGEYALASKKLTPHMRKVMDEYNDFDNIP